MKRGFPLNPVLVERVGQRGGGAAMSVEGRVLGADGIGELHPASVSVVGEEAGAGLVGAAAVEPLPRPGVGVVG